MTSKQRNNWIPEIFYEEDSLIPFINVPDGEKNPELLFISINRMTGEYEPGPRGEKLPIMDMQLCQFASLTVLAEKLSSSDYDKVRAALGLEPRASAARKGRQITRNVATRMGADLE